MTCAQKRKLRARLFEKQRRKCFYCGTGLTSPSPTTCPENMQHSTISNPDPSEDQTSRTISFSLVSPATEPKEIPLETPSPNFSCSVSEPVLQVRLAAGNLRRKYDEILVELARLAKDKCPEPDEYPEELCGVAERIRYYADRQ